MKRQRGVKRKVLEITAEQARSYVMQAQCLHCAQPFGGGKKAALAAIEHLGYVQIDTISVVERAHHHVLWARVPDYKPQFLHQMQSVDRSIFEYWSHAASYIPMKDYRYCMPRMERFKKGERRWFDRDPKIMKRVWERIKNEGPLRSSDFLSKGRGGGPWFDRTPEKKALEYLVDEGELMVTARQGFQKIYDLRERVLPKEINTQMPSPREFLRFLIESCLRTQGIAAEAEIRYLRKNLKTELTEVLSELEEEHAIASIRVQGIDKIYFAQRHELTRFLNKKSQKGDRAIVKILSPFDNAVIQRGRLKEIFGFEYTLECYVPEAKRVFGYFTLPLTLGDRFIGKLDAKADRGSGTFEVRALQLSKSLSRTDRELVQAQLKEFAHWNGCTKLEKKCTGP